MSDEMRLEVVVAGVGGRMGREVARAAVADPAVDVLGGLEAPGHSLLGRSLRDLGLPADCQIAEELDALLSPARPASRGAGQPSGGRPVLIEFCLASGAVRHARRAAELGFAVVSGSTALGESDEQALQEIAMRVPVFRAPNFSRGATALLAYGLRMVRALGSGFDVEIVESHHRRKRDVPSGTALALAQAIREARGGGTLVTGRRATDGLRADGEIGIHGVRAGELVGEHRLLLAAAGETVELIHRVYGREAFASGALDAARLVSRLEPGTYGMGDLVEICGA